MFGIGTSEILVVLLIALIVLGPKEIPKVARTMGRIMNNLQKAKEDLRHAIDVEIEQTQDGDKAQNSKNAERSEINNRPKTDITQ